MNLMIILLLFFSANFSVQAQAQEQEVTVITNEWPPYNFKNNNEIVGINTELITAALKKSGVKYKLLVYPFKRALNTVRTTPNTLLFTVARTPEVENTYKWIGPIHNREVYIYKLSSRPQIQVNNIEDVKNYRATVVRGGSVEQFLIRNNFKVNEDYFVAVNAEKTLDLLFRNRTDLIAAEQLGLAYRIRKSGHHHSEIEKIYLLSNEGAYYMVANKQTPDELITRIQASLDEVLASGVRSQIIEKYIGN